MMKSLLYKIFGSVLIVFVIVSCSEDTIDVTGLGTVRGTVVKNGTNEPLEDVKLSTNPPTSTVFTDEDGNYKIDNVPVGEYTLSAQKDGLLAEFESISIIADKELEVVFEMDVETAGNKPPNTPVLLTPVDNAVNQPIEVELKWTASDPDEDDLKYTVTLRNDENTDIEVFENITDTTYTVSGLQFGVKYFWQVAASDEINTPVNSATFAFTTQSAPNNRIVYTRIVQGNSVIYSADETGGTEVQLTSETKNSFRPRRNVNTRQIAFLRSVGSQTHLFIMKEDGSQEQQVTSQVGVSGFNLEEIDFAWDANGAKLLFPNQDKLYAIDTDGGGLSLIYQTANGKLITEVDKNELTGTIALKTNDLDGYGVEIFTINTSGVIQNTILTGVSGAAGGINLSLDGTRLLYTYDVSEFESSSYRRLNSHVFVYTFSSDTRVDVSTEKPDGTNDLDARFSPNEVSVIYINTSNDGISVKNIETMEIDGDNRNTLIENAAMPDWE